MYNVFNEAMSIKSDNDPYSEFYYYNKIKERDQTENKLNHRNFKFLSEGDKYKFEKQNLQREIEIKNFSRLSQSLGVLQRHNLRTPSKQLDVSTLQVEEGNSKATHIRVLSSIEVVYFGCFYCVVRLLCLVEDRADKGSY